MEREAMNERNRSNHEILMQRELLEEEEKLRLQRESMRRSQSLENEKALEEEKHKAEMENLRVEMEMKKKADIQSEQLRLETIVAKGQEERKQMMETVETVFSHASNFVVNVATVSPGKLMAIMGAVFSLILGYILVKELAAGLRQIVEQKLGRPSLVRETSRKRYIPCFLGLTPSKDEAVGEAYFQDVILEKALKARVVSLAMSIRNARKNKAPFRHILLYGPPGNQSPMYSLKPSKSSNRYR